MNADARAGAPYQYVVLRCVPRVEREEFVNVGLVLHCPEHDYLASASRLDADRLSALAPGIDIAHLTDALRSVEDVCRGAEHTAFGATLRATSTGTREAVDDQGTRFGFLKAPRSTVLQPGPVHGGITDDPALTLDRLLARLVG